MSQGQPHQPQSSFTPAAVRKGADWLRGVGSESDVVVSSRVRLARNLAACPFPSRASRQQRQDVLDVVRDRLMTAGIARQVLWVDVHKAPALDRTLMVERHLISKEHARGPVAQQAAGGTPGSGSGGNAEPRGVGISLPDESLSVMVNEEDHLRLQVLLSGLELTAAYEQIDRVDDLMEGACGQAGRVLEYAYSSRYGYLTACPTNVGTGIRVSVMLHLPALKLTGEMEKVRRAFKDMSLAVRGYYGEGSEAAGEFYQFSNQSTLGKPESIILHEFEQEIIPQVIHYERSARRLLVDKRRRFLEDRVCRALAILRSARLLKADGEHGALALLSDVRLGIVTGLVTDVTEQTVNQLILLAQPAHLQRALGREMDQGQRLEARADLVRERLAV